MLGVVLWSDHNDRKAVIWCEDHGDLAYFSGAGDSPAEMPPLDAGDLVDFELCQDSHLRLARNPQRFEQGAFDGIVTQLQVAKPSPRSAASGTRGESPSPAATVIPFKRDRFERADRDFAII